MTYRLGIDIGTSGVRTAVLDPDDTVVSEARASHPPQLGDVIDAEGWWQAVEACLHAQVAAMRAKNLSPEAIEAVAVDGTSGSMVLTDAALRPVSPALMYNSTGFTAEAAEIARHAPGTHITRGSNSALARAMRLVGQAASKPAHLLHQADFIAARLTGVGGFSDANNALKTGFDPESESWPDWAGAVIDTRLLPRVLPVGRPVARLLPDVAAQFGLSSTAVLYTGTTDSIAAFLAAAPLEAGVAVTSLGSTLAVKSLSETRIDDPKIGLYSHKVGDVWLAGGASNTGGAVLAAHFAPDELAALSDGLDEDPETGLDYYPLLRAGERFPVNDPDLAPCLEPRPPSDRTFLRGMLEAMTRIEAACYAAISARGGGTPHVIYSAGGGAKNAAWTAMRQSHLGIALKRARSAEASVGVASLAGKDS